jgi:F0F1-type ATP synthase assembly protein I
LRAVADDERSAAKYAGIGLQFAISIIVFLFAGQWLDRKFGTSPIFLILGVFVGAGAAFYSMYRKLMADQDAEDKARRR